MRNSVLFSMNQIYRKFSSFRLPCLCYNFGWLQNIKSFFLVFFTSYECCELGKWWWWLSYSHTIWFIEMVELELSRHCVLQSDRVVVEDRLRLVMLNRVVTKKSSLWWFKRWMKIINILLFSFLSYLVFINPLYVNWRLE